MSELSSRFSPAEIEERQLEFWNGKGFYGPVEDPKQGNLSRKSYVIAIPPPNVTGILHMGHALNNTLQDILIRWRRMQGYNTLWVPGTDHASIATESKVTTKLRKEGIDKHEIGRDEFLKHAWEWTEEYGGTIIKQLKRMGCSCDWTRERFTMDEMCSKAVRAAFKRLYDKGLIYRGKYLVNWCPSCQTVISNDEVEYKEQNGHLWHIRYPLKVEQENTGETPVPQYLVVATTRPETMLGDTAVAINPKDERNQHLLGQTVILPLMNREIPVIADEFVDPEFGTGCVKVTPAHDPNDFDMGRRHNLEMINILNEDGTLNENTGAYAGMDRYDGRKQVVADLEAQGLLEKIEDYKNNIGCCYRSGDVVEPFLSDQWFVKMKPLAEPAIKAVREGRTKIVPKQYENTYYHWMENVRDWPISRQLFWGHRIPIWFCKDDPTKMICWGGEGNPPEVDADPDAWRQEEDILDTWFSSALWPFSTLGWPDETPDLKAFYPTSTLVTAHEILFFWVARMIMMGLECMDDVPFSDVYIHAMIFDLETRSKMSKSLGNIIDPLEMIDKYGADAMRYTLCAYAITGRNIYLSEQRFEGYRNFMNKIWNASRFVLMNTESLDAGTFARGVKPDELKLEDRWILHRLRTTISEVNRNMERFAFDAVGHDIYHFIWDDYCDWYVELAKARCTGEDARDREVAQIVLISALDAVLRLMHPISPFVTEELWQILKERFGGAAADGAGVSNSSVAALASDSIMTASYPAAEDYAEDAKAEEAMTQLQEIITAIRRLRAGVNLPPKERTNIYIAADDCSTRVFVTTHQTYIASCVPADEIIIRDEIQADGCALTEQLEKLRVAIPISAEVRDKEVQRLQKEIGKLEGGLAGLEKKLGNENFVNNASPDVVEKERKRQQEMQNDLARAQEKLAALQG
ncbi:valine--tRNA ligase [Candidatus Sumerlaeota bacterium]|nr:valine--tRNA ligase [Candidatus Sumerlaeota bacterium]